MKRLFLTILVATALPVLGYAKPNAVKSGQQGAQEKKEAVSYDVYVGKYDVAPGFELTITNENNKLMGQPTGDAKIEFKPETEPDRFFSSQENVHLRFGRDEAGAVIGVIVTIDGKDFQAKKIK